MFEARVTLPAATLHEIMLATDHDIATDRQALGVRGANPDAVESWLVEFRDAIDTALSEFKRRREEPHAHFISRGDMP